MINIFIPEASVETNDSSAVSVGSAALTVCCGSCLLHHCAKLASVLKTPIKELVETDIKTKVSDNKAIIR